jgi:hypothetical protein
METGIKAARISEQKSRATRTVTTSLTTLTSMIRRRLKSLQFTSPGEGLWETEGQIGAPLDSSYRGSVNLIAEYITSPTQGLESNGKS